MHKRLLLDLLAFEEVLNMEGNPVLSAYQRSHISLSRLFDFFFTSHACERMEKKPIRGR